MSNTESATARCVLAFAGFGSRDDHDEALVLAVQRAADDASVGPGDLAVLVPTNRLVSEYTSVVSDLGLATQKLPRLEPGCLGEASRHNEDDRTDRCGSACSAASSSSP